jgi:putative component of membrane protein insertase Oxa1/YidC/SpoIIIJ protein YidD
MTIYKFATGLTLQGRRVLHAKCHVFHANGENLVKAQPALVG